MSDNIAKFRKQGTSVERVVSRLDKHQDQIESITAIVTWKNGNTDVCYNEKPTGDIAYESLLLQGYVINIISGDGDD